MRKDNRILSARFTLIEILVGILLMGVVLSGAYKILHSVPTTAATHQHLLLGSRHGWRTVNRLASLIQTAPYQKAGAHKDGFSLSGEVEDIEFGDETLFSQNTESLFPERTLPADVMRIPRILTGAEDGEEELVFVEYTVKYDYERQLYGMFSRTSGVSETVQEGDWELESDRVVGFRARFLADHNENEVWERGWQEKHPPVAVELSVWVRVSPAGKPLKLETFKSVVNIDYGRVIGL